MSKFKVVFHMDEQVKVSLILDYISNLITDIGVENLEIEMVANGDAVKVFEKSKSEFGRVLQELAEKEVVFCACAIALRNLGIRRKELLFFVTIVSSGIGEIINKKAAGWSYICP
ncbi:MAG TPA: DsrE family protein [Desulfosporosinus sp.]